MSGWPEVEQDVSEGQRIELAVALANRLSAARQSHRAARLWLAIIRKQPHDIDATWALAGALRADGQLEQALTVLIQFIQQNPSAIDIPHKRFEDWMNSFETAARFPQLVDKLSGSDVHDGITDFLSWVPWPPPPNSGSWPKSFLVRRWKPSRISR